MITIVCIREEVISTWPMHHQINLWHLQCQINPRHPHHHIHLTPVCNIKDSLLQFNHRPWNLMWIHEIPIFLFIVPQAVMYASSLTTDCYSSSIRNGWYNMASRIFDLFFNNIFVFLLVKMLYILVQLFIIQLVEKVLFRDEKQMSFAFQLTKFFNFRNKM
jgi:hypothetical protein